MRRLAVSDSFLAPIWLGEIGPRSALTHLGTCNLIHVYQREHTQTDTHTRADNEIHAFTPADRDNIKAAERRESCRSRLGERGHRRDPLLRPFITRHQPLPVGL